MIVPGQDRIAVIDLSGNYHIYSDRVFFFHHLPWPYSFPPFGTYEFSHNRNGIFYFKEVE